MNETEELALDTVPTGGPKEVLTEQANNNPEVQVSEALPLPAEEVDPVVNENNIDPVIPQEIVPAEEVKQEEQVEFPFVDSPYAYDNVDADGIQLASALGFKSLSQLWKVLGDKAEELPGVGEVVKTKRKLDEKKRIIKEQIDRDPSLDTDFDKLSPEEQALAIRKNLENLGITYQSGDNPMLLIDGENFINDITKGVYEDEKVVNGFLGDTRIFGSKGDRKLPDEEYLLNLIAYVAERYNAGFTAQKGGVDKMKVQAMQQLGELVLLTDKNLTNKLLNLHGGQLPDVGTIFAMRDIYNIQARKFDAMISDLGTNPGPQDIMDLREQLEIVANLQMKISGVKTDLGRALRFLREPSGMGPDGVVVPTTGRPMEKLDPETGEVIQEGFKYRKSEQTPVTQDDDINRVLDLQNSLDRVGGQKGLLKFYQAYNNMPTQHGKAKLLRDFIKYGRQEKVGDKNIGRFFDNVAEYWMNALLSSPLTHARNMVGNMLMITQEMGQDILIGAYNSLKVKGGGTIESDQILFRDAVDSAGLTVMTLMEALQGAWTQMRTGQKPSQIGETTRFDTGHNRKISAETWGYDADNPMIMNMFNYAGSIINTPMQALGAEDTFFKVLAQRYYIALEAKKSARTKGLTGEDAIDYVTEFIVDPPEDALNLSRKNANYAVFQEELKGNAKAISRGISTVPGLRYMIPFFKTPYNIARVTFRDGTPLGMLFRSEVQDVMANGTKAQKQKAIVRMTSGTSLIAMSAMWASMGYTQEDGTYLPNLTPGILKEQWTDKKDIAYKTMLRDKGMPEYGFLTIKDGEPHYTNIRGLEPFSSFIGVGVDFYNIMANPDLITDEDEATAIDYLMGVGFALANSMRNKTFMTSLDRTITLVNSPMSYGERAVNNFISSFTPAIIRQMGDLNDPVSRQALTTWDSFVRTLPGVRTSLPPKKDINGEERPRITNVVNPFVTTEVKPFTNLEKNHWRVFKKHPTFPDNKVSTNFGIGTIEIKDADLLDMIHREYAVDYHKYMELYLSMDWAYKQARQRWIDSNYTDIESRDEAMTTAQKYVNQLRKQTITRIYYNPMKYGEEGKKLRELIDKKKDKKNKANLKKLGLEQ